MNTYLCLLHLSLFLTPPLVLSVCLAHFQIILYLSVCLYSAQHVWSILFLVLCFPSCPKMMHSFLLDNGYPYFVVHILFTDIHIFLYSSIWVLDVLPYISQTENINWWKTKRVLRVTCVFIALYLHYVIILRPYILISLSFSHSQLSLFLSQNSLSLSHWTLSVFFWQK